MAGSGRRFALTPRVAVRTGIAAWAVGLGLRLVTLWLWISFGQQATSSFGIALTTYLAGFTLGTVTSTVGVLIVARRPGNAVGWLLVGAGLFQAIVGLAIAHVGLVRTGAFLTTEITFVWVSGLGLQVFPWASRHCSSRSSRTATSLLEDGGSSGSWPVSEWSRGPSS